MKKFLSLLFLLTVMLMSPLSAYALKYEEAINQSKPMAILVYAPWADNQQTCMQAFKAMEQQYAAQYNFVLINIATADAKAFNKTYHIYPNLPYVLLFKDRGKISRYLKADCVMNNTCFTDKLNLFIN